MQVLFAILPVIVILASALVLSLVACILRCRRRRRRFNDRSKLLAVGVVPLPSVSSIHRRQQQHVPASSSLSLSASIHATSATYDQHASFGGAFESVPSVTSDWTLWFRWFTGKVCGRCGSRKETPSASFRNSGLMTTLLDVRPQSRSRRRFVDNVNYFGSTLPSHTAGKY